MCKVTWRRGGTISWNFEGSVLGCIYQPILVILIIMCLSHDYCRYRLYPSTYLHLSLSSSKIINESVRHFIAPCLDGLGQAAEAPRPGGERRGRRRGVEPQRRAACAPRALTMQIPPIFKKRPAGPALLFFLFVTSSTKSH